MWQFTKQNKIRFLHKLSTLFEIIRTYKNWYIFVLDYLNCPRGGYTTTYLLRNGVKLRAINGAVDSAILSGIWTQKVYNPPGFEIKENETVVDIGANKGYFSIFAATSANGVKVYSYEPFLENFKYLKENIELNNLQATINVFNLGIAKDKGECCMQRIKNITGIEFKKNSFGIGILIALIFRSFANRC